MLSDEEKEVLEILKSFEPDDLVECAIYLQALEKIKNLIEKQSKEIEHQKEKRENQKKELAILNAKQIEFNKLVNTVNSYKGQFKRQQKEIELLKEENEKYKNPPFFDEDDYTENDKIKAKIEELDYKMIAHQDVREAVRQVLQSLLEKE